jgi:hypothetical protein
MVVLALVSAQHAPSAVGHHHPSDNRDHQRPVAGAAAGQYGIQAESRHLTRCSTADCETFALSRGEFALKLIASGIASAGQNDETVGSPWLGLDPPVPR